MAMQPGHSSEPVLFQGAFAVSVLALKLFVGTSGMCLPSPEPPAFLWARSVGYPVNFMQDV